MNEWVRKGHGVRRLLAHEVEPGGAAWTDTRWVAQAVKKAEAAG
jgi:hypothetical protein